MTPKQYSGLLLCTILSVFLCETNGTPLYNEEYNTYLSRKIRGSQPFSMDQSQYSYPRSQQAVVHQFYETIERINQLKETNGQKNDELTKKEKTNHGTEIITKLSQSLDSIKKGTSHVEAKGGFHIVNCTACKLIINVLQTALELDIAQEEIVKLVQSFCKKFRIESDKVCDDVVKQFRDEVLTVVGDLVLNSDEVCGFIFGQKCGDFYDPFQMWNVSFPNSKKPPINIIAPKKGTKKLRVLQLADIHVDFKYKVGSNAECHEPVCCHEDDGPPKHDPAGYWGDARYCDTPRWTLENLFDHLSKNEKFDYIIWLGDLIGHRIWNQTRQEQLNVLNYITEMFQKYFPNTPVYPSLGNHEGVPVNSFPIPSIKGNESAQWLYTELAKQWGMWLPNDTLSDIKKGAYYTTLVQPGFRIVSLNMNYCNNLNFWLYLNTTDPADELQWLIGVLQKAENNKEKVHILGHIPPGSSGCLKAWSWNFYKIINRYESTVTAQFYAHVHNDLYTLFFDDVKFTRPVGVAYIGPSVTPYSDINPGYRIYVVDGDHGNSTRMVVDHENYIMNLTEANLSKKAKWEFEYSAMSAYNMTNLLPENWKKLFDQLKNDDTAFQKYYNYYFKSYGQTHTCDEKCKRAQLCTILSSRSHDPSLCKDLEMEFGEYTDMLMRTGNCD